MPNKIFKGLPAKAYTDKDFWQKESDTVFTNSWVFVGFVHELINIGDALPITIANQPILILKNANIKFSKRWQKLEKKVKKENLVLHKLSMKKYNLLWEKVK